MTDAHVKLWDAINDLTAARGGRSDVVNGRCMDAVAAVERAIHARAMEMARPRQIAPTSAAVAENRVRGAALKLGKPVSKTEMARSAGGKAAHVRDAIDRLLEAGELVESDIPRRGRGAGVGLSLPQFAIKKPGAEVADVHRSSLTDVIAVAEYETSAARDHVRALLAILDEIGGYRTIEQQDAVRAAKGGST